MDFNLLLPCKFKIGEQGILIEYRKTSEDIYREFGSVEDCNNLKKNEIIYLAGKNSNRVWHKEADPLEYRNASGTARAVGAYALSLTRKNPTENLERCVKMSKDSCPEFIKLLCDNLKNESLTHKVSFICSDADIRLIEEKLKKERMKLSPNRAYIEESEMLLHNIFEYRKCPSFKDQTIFFEIIGLSMGPVTYLNKQAKSPRKEESVSQWNTHLAYGKNEEFSYEEEVRIELFMSSPYSERPDTYFLTPLIRHIQICSPGISKFFGVCTETKTEELFIK